MNLFSNKSSGSLPVRKISALVLAAFISLNLCACSQSDNKETPVSKFSKSKSAYKQKESKVNTFFEDIWFVSKAAKNNSCQIVMPRTKRDC